MSETTTSCKLIASSSPTVDSPLKSASAEAEVVANVTDAPGVSGVTRRTKSPGIFEPLFRRRSKSDCKSTSLTSDSSVPATPSSSSGPRRRGNSFIASIKSHIPWSDRRANSIECGHSYHDNSCVTCNSSGHRSHHLHDGSSSCSTSSNHHQTPSSSQPINAPTVRSQKGRFTCSPQVPSVLLQGNNQHNNLDPYYTYTYGQDHRHLFRRTRSGSGSSVARVMDIFKTSRSESLSHSGSGSATPSGLLNSGSGSVKRSFDFTDLRENDSEHLVFVKFFEHYKCYDLIPISAKLIVFDTQLLVKKAFHALVSNGVRAAPLWDSESQQYVGMLTITDFINILRMSYNSPGLKLDDLEDQKLSKWRTLLDTQVRPLSNVSPDATLFDAIKTLIHEKVHRLPVVDDETKNVLYIMTHKRILKFLFLYFKDLPIPRHLDQPIRQLNIGTYENIATTTMDTPLIDVLNTFIERRVSALPVVDQNGKVIDIYAKFDVINLAAEKTYNNLDITIKKALEYRDRFFEGVVTCTSDHTLSQVVEKVVKAEVHRIVVVDSEDQVIGMISLSDLLSFLTLKPVAMERIDTLLPGTPSLPPSEGTLIEESEDNVSDTETES